MRHGTPIQLGQHLGNDALVIAVTEKEVYGIVLGLVDRNKHTPYATWEYRIDRRGGTYAGHYFAEFFDAAKDYKGRVEGIE